VERQRTIRATRQMRSSSSSTRSWRSRTPMAQEDDPVSWRSTRRAPCRRLAQSCQAQIGDGLKVVGRPSVDLLNVINRNDEEEDRVVIRVRLRIYCKHPSLGTLPGGLFAHHTHIDERWILGRSGDQVVLLSWGGDPLAEPVLTAPLIPTPSSDTGRLREESLAELADAQKAGDDVDLSDLVSAEEDPPWRCSISRTSTLGSNQR